MGDTGSNLLGYLMAVITVQGALKTNAVVALASSRSSCSPCRSSTPASSSPSGSSTAGRSTAPTVSTSTTGWRASASRQRRTIAYLYGWTLILAGVALALRFVPYTDNHGNFDPFWTVVMAALPDRGAGGQRLRGRGARDPEAAQALPAAPAHRHRQVPEAPPVEAEVDAGVLRELETGTFAAVNPETGEMPAVDPDTGEMEAIESRPRRLGAQPPPRPERPARARDRGGSSSCPRGRRGPWPPRRS